MGTHRVNLWTQRNHPPTPLPRKGKVAHKQLMMVHFAMLCKASPCGCHLFKKEDLHKSKVVGWHDDGIDSKSNELTGPIMNVWSNVHVITHPHTYIHMLIGCRNFPSDVIKVSKRKSLLNISLLFTLSQVFPSPFLQYQKASHLMNTIWYFNLKMIPQRTLCLALTGYNATSKYFPPPPFLHLLQKLA